MSGTILATHAPAPARTAADLRSHYDAVRARLWGRTVPVAEPSPPPPANPKRKRPPIVYPAGRLRAYSRPIGPVKPIRRGIRLRSIIAATAAEFGVSIEALTGNRRLARVARARQAAYFVARRLTALSYPQIGIGFGGKDHTTVMHGCQVIEERHQRDPAFAARIDAIMATVRARA